MSKELDYSIVRNTLLFSSLLFSPLLSLICVCVVLILCLGVCWWWSLLLYKYKFRANLSMMCRMCRQAGRQASKQSRCGGSVQCKRRFAACLSTKNGTHINMPFITHACIIRDNNNNNNNNSNKIIWKEKLAAATTTTNSFNSLTTSPFFFFFNCFFTTLYHDAFQLAWTKV